MWVCIYIEKESRRTSHFGKSLEMGIASGSHFLTPRSLRRPRKEPFFFLYFLSEIHNATLSVLYNRLTSYPSLISMVYRAVEISLLSLSSSKIEWMFDQMELHKLPPQVRSRPYTHPFFSQFLSVFFRSYCANWVLCVPQGEAAYFMQKSTLLQWILPKIFFFFFF